MGNFGDICKFIGTWHFISLMETGESAGSGDIELFANWNGLLALTTALSFSCFSILSAVIATRVVVSEYCGRKAVVLLSYPINRKAILGTKCLVVSGITTVFAFISNTMVIGIMYISAHIFRIMPQMNTEHFSFTVLISSFLMGIMSSTVGIISTAFGWKKRSVVATIVCSLFMVCVFSNCVTIFPDNIVWEMMAMSAVFVMIAYITYHFLANGIEKMDNMK